MTQEIDLYNRINNPVEAIVQLGQYFAKSGLAGCNNEAQGIVLAWECAAKRKSPSDIVAENDIVDGKLRKKSLAVAARFQEQGGKIKWLATGEGEPYAEAEYSIDGETVKTRFTLDDAKKQGLLKPNSGWAKTPGNMLRARCHTNGIGMLRPGLVLGLELGDEPESIPETKPLLTKKQEAEPKPAKVGEIRTMAPESPTEPPSPSQNTPATEVVSQSKVPPAKPVVSNWTILKDSKKISAEGAAALGEIIPADKQAAAIKWLEGKGWIAPMGSLLDLSPNRAKLIYEQPEKFLQKIGA